jgi:hypothetical protein
MTVLPTLKGRLEAPITATEAGGLEQLIQIAYRHGRFAPITRLTLSK